MEILWIIIAYALGLAAASLRLPPLVGYLLGGFLLFALGIEENEALAGIAHLGVLLLLFTVGLKLRIRSFLQVQVIGAGLLHLLLVAVLIGLGGVALGSDPIPAALFALMIAFSSTILAVKVLEERQELGAIHSRIAIGILILQDLVAVLILTLTGMRQPSGWALVLLLLIQPARLLLVRLLEATRQRELIILFGLGAALGGGALFEFLGLSSELGALTAGVLLAGQPQAEELSKRLWGMRETFLVGFFLEIGLAGLPSSRDLLLVLALMLLLPLKTLLYFVISAWFKLRARTAFLAAAALASYSEFGLIAGRGAAAAGLIPESTLTAMALTIAVSFTLCAPLNRAVHKLYGRLEPLLTRFERTGRHPDDHPGSVGQSRVVIAGMGRTGTSTYDWLGNQDCRPIGIDSDPDVVQRLLETGRRVVYGDSADLELWERMRLDRVAAVILTVPDLEARTRAAQALRARGYTGVISALSFNEGDEAALHKAGVTVVYNPLTEAGREMARKSIQP
ncbi:MAG: cation:proton antiporter [Firmicutes bacterium]|nr:cation:proton antiporter [Bacillota bacterium]